MVLIGVEDNALQCTVPIIARVYLLRLALILSLVLTQFALGDLQRQVESIVANSELNHGRVGICIIDTSTNETLVEIHANDSMIPASNQKLLTTGAALHVLGPSFSFQTKLLQDGKNLIVVGDGDPTLGDTELGGITDWSNEQSMLDAELKPWINAVKNAGIRSVDTLYIDDRIFDQNFVHPSWPADQINHWYCAQVSGINYHLNVVHFFPSPIRGTKANLGNIAPYMPWLTIKNNTTSKTGKKESSSFWVARPPNSNNLTARGNVKTAHTKPVKVAIHDPAMIFGNTLATALRANGISVSQIKRVSTSAPPSQGKKLYVRTTPISDALLRSNRDSYNLYAEVLLKRLAALATGRPGTFDEGATVVEAAVTQRLSSNQHLTVADGSGMSRNNRVSPTTLARWLASFNIEEPTGNTLLRSLATPGTGTLRSRFKDMQFDGATIYAKSGYLRGVCTLSGYIVFENGRLPLVFSILVNEIKGTVKGAKKMQERIVFAAFVEAR